MPVPPFEIPQAHCRFGLATADVTPPAGIYHRMWGAALHDQAEGVHRPLLASAIVLDPLGAGAPLPAGQVLIALDHCLLWGKEMDALLHRTAEGSGQHPDSLVFCFSHTHAAGLMDPSRKDLPGGHKIEPYLEDLAATCARLVHEARAKARPAWFAFAQGRCALAGHRDLWDSDLRQFVCGFNPGGPADDTLLVGRVTDDHGRSLATLVNYACHPTTLAWQNRLVSPDYPGAMRELVEQSTSAPCMFIQGASGDLGPKWGFTGDPAVADRNGRILGYAVLSLLESLPPSATRFEYEGATVSGATLGIWNHRDLSSEARQACAIFSRRCIEVPLEYRAGLGTADEVRADLTRWQQELQSAQAVGTDAELQKARAMQERATRRLTRLSHLPPGPQFMLPVTILRMGGTVWVAVEGEPYQSLQQELRRAFPRAAVVVAGLANGSRCSYLPGRAAYGTGVYQESIALLSEGSLERLTDMIRQAIERILAC